MNLDTLLDRLKTAAAALTPRQMITLALVFVAVVALTIGSAYWLNTPDYAVLYDDMDTEKAGKVVNALKTDKVPHVLEDSGRTVRVPKERLQEIKIKYDNEILGADASLSSGPCSSGSGFGITDFQERTRYQQCLESSIARNVAGIDGVAGARVTLAIPPQTVFVTREQPTKASVFVRLRGRQLEARTRKAITAMVAASVPGLKAEAVALMDSRGTLLVAPSSDDEDSLGALGGTALEQKHLFEQELKSKVVGLLDTAVGPGRAAVSIAAEFTRDKIDSTETKYGDTPRTTSSQTTSSQSVGVAPPNGTSGSRANLPPATGTGAAPAAPPGSTQVGPTTQQSGNSVINIFDTTLVRTVKGPGELSRLSVAVTLHDDVVPGGQAGAPRQAKPRSREELDKIQDQVSKAVGLNEERGDQISVQSFTFEEIPMDVAPPVLSVWKRNLPQATEIGRTLGVVLIVGFVIFGVVRPTVRSVLGPPLATALPPGVAFAGALAAPGGAAGTGAAATPAKTVAEMEDEIEKQLQEEADKLLQVRRGPVLVKRLTTMTQREPENAARLLRTWLNEEEPR